MFPKNIKLTFKHCLTQFAVVESNFCFSLSRPLFYTKFVKTLSNVINKLKIEHVFYNSYLCSKSLLFFFFCRKRITFRIHVFINLQIDEKCEKVNYLFFPSQILEFCQVICIKVLISSLGEKRVESNELRRPELYLFCS